MKTIQNLRNSLKYKAPTVEDSVAVIIDGKLRLIRGAEVRILAGSEFAFISIPSVSLVARIGDDTLYPLNDVEDASAAARDITAQLEPRKRVSNQAAFELPEELKTALQAIPPGHRLEIGADGSTRLVRTRNRRKKDTN